MIVYSYKDSVENYVTPAHLNGYQPEDMFHLGDYNGIHYFSYNPDTVTLAENPSHEQKEYKTEEEKAELAQVLPYLLYLQARLRVKKEEFLSQYDQFTLIRLAVNSTGSFKTAINAKNEEINAYLASLGF
jgi:hypothetical protein